MPSHKDMAATMASTVASTNAPVEGSDSSLGSQKRDPFSHLLKFPEEMEPVYEDLADEQQERRQLDAVRIQKNIMYLDRINDELDIDVKERIESDQLIEKLAISRLDNMQRKLVTQVSAPPAPRHRRRTTCMCTHGSTHTTTYIHTLRVMHLDSRCQFTQQKNEGPLFHDVFAKE